MDSVAFLQQEIAETCLQLAQLEARLEQLRIDYGNALLLQEYNLKHPGDNV